MPSRKRTMKGGFLDEVANTASNGWNSLTQTASDVWSKTKEALSPTPSTSYVPSYTPAPAPSYKNYGGKKAKGKGTKKHMRGGFKDNVSHSTLAHNASSISGIHTAQPRSLVGGKSKKRHHKGKHSKTRKHRKTRRH
jgi:hypothetical protein